MPVQKGGVYWLVGGGGGVRITRHFLRASCLFRYRSELQQWDE